MCYCTTTPGAATSCDKLVLFHRLFLEKRFNCASDSNEGVYIPHCDWEESKCFSSSDQRKQVREPLEAAHNFTLFENYHFWRSTITFVNRRRVMKGSMSYVNKRTCSRLFEASVPRIRHQGRDDDQHYSERPEGWTMIPFQHWCWNRSAKHQVKQSSTGRRRLKCNCEKKMKFIHSVKTAYIVKGLWVQRYFGLCLLFCWGFSSHWAFGACLVCVLGKPSPRIPVNQSVAVLCSALGNEEAVKRNVLWLN